MKTILATLCLLTATAACADEISSTIADRARAALPPGLGLVDVALSSSLKTTGPVSAELSWRVAPHVGTVNVMVTLRRKHKEVARGWARLKLAAMKSVLVTCRAIAAGSPLRAGDVLLGERAVEAGQGLVADPAALIGQTAMRDLDADQIVQPGDVAQPPPIARGTEVRVLIKRGAVTVTVPGLLERQARLGEMTSARLEVAHRVITGRLIDASTLLNEGGAL